MPFQGTYPNETYIRTDGTRTGLDVWKNAESAGIDIVSTDHDTHDQDIASAINTLNARIGELDSAIGMVLFSEATASTSHVYEFTLNSAYQNRLVFENFTTPQAGPADVVLQFRTQSANSALLNSADAYGWVRDGYSGEPSAIVLDAYDSAAASIPLATGLAGDTGDGGMSGVIDIYDPFRNVTTFVEGTIFYTRLTTPRSLNVVHVGGFRTSRDTNHVVVITMNEDPSAGGHIRHYGIRKPGNNITS